jgi:hypothetical protein
MLRYQSIAPRDAQAIAATFSGLKRMAPGRAAGNQLLYGGGGASLEIVPGTGMVIYNPAPSSPSAVSPLQGATQAPPANALAAGSAPWRAAVATARGWLDRHHLYPGDVDATATQVLAGGGITLVRFAPSLPGLGAGVLVTVQGALPTLTVDLDSSGHVTSAYSLWLRLVATGTQRLVDVATAVAASPAAPQWAATPRHPPSGTAVFTITSLSLVYTVDTAARSPGGAGRLQPSSYLLQGQLREPEGIMRPYAAQVPAASPPVGTRTPAAASPAG